MKRFQTLLNKMIIMRMLVKHGVVFCLNTKLHSSKKGPTSDRVVTLKTGRREAPGSNPGKPIRSEFSVVFSETRVNTG